MGSVNVRRGTAISRSRPSRDLKRTVVDSMWSGLGWVRAQDHSTMTWPRYAVSSIATASGSDTGPLLIAWLSMSDIAGASTWVVRAAKLVRSTSPWAASAGLGLD